MRICFSDTFTGEDEYVDVPGATFGPMAVNVAVSNKIDPDGEWPATWRMEAWAIVDLSARPGEETACFIMRQTNPSLDAMLIHGVVYMSYDPKSVPQ
jgi:hypothetical protein